MHVKRKDFSTVCSTADEKPSFPLDQMSPFLQGPSRSPGVPRLACRFINTWTRPSPARARNSSRLMTGLHLAFLDDLLGLGRPQRPSEMLEPLASRLTRFS